AEVNDLRRWEAWSPWAKIDPAMKRTYDGPPAGAGAVSEWSGNNKVGAGRMTITDSRPHERIRIKLEFFRPFKAINTAEFTFTPQGGQTQVASQLATEVTWSMSGEKNFASKAFGLFVNMDKMIGGEFDKGLAQLKTIAESAATK